MMTAEQKARVLRGASVPLPEITSCPLADGREMRVGETWAYGNGPPHTLYRVEGRPPLGGVDQPGEPFPEFVTHPKGYGRLGFDAVQEGDPAKWRRIV
jgi:hypothetical protein